MPFFKKFDWWLFFPIIAISILGLLIQLSVAPNLFNTQLMFLFFGFLLFFLFSNIDFNIYSPLKKIIYIASLIGLFVTFFIGQETRGSVRWISIGAGKIQPSEIIKPFFIIFLGFYFTGQGKKWKKLFYAVLAIAPILLLIFKQPDLGNTIVYAAIFAGFLIEEGYLLVLLLGIISLAVSMPFVWNLLHDYQKNRLITFLNPGIDPQGTGYNALQATIAVGSGGLFGKGLGRGTQSHLQFLPEHHTDFIFASFAEEFGFVGITILIALYVFLLLRILIIAQKSTSKEASSICVGVFSMLIAQIFINIGMNIGLVPITGITLPLLSYGGSSILATMISLGLVESLAKTQKTESPLLLK